MKELEKTQRLSIASVLVVLLVLISLLMYKRPKHIYNTNSKNTLEKVISDDYFIGLDQINNPDYILVDVRNQIEYNKGHLDHAINIYTPELLNKINSKLLKKIKKQNKTMLLYGNNPHETIAQFMLLYQIGYKNTKILTVENSYFENKLITKNSPIENATVDINAFIKESVKKASLKP